MIRIPVRNLGRVMAAWSLAASISGCISSSYDLSENHRTVFPIKDGNYLYISETGSSSIASITREGDRYIFNDGNQVEYWVYRIDSYDGFILKSSASEASWHYLYANISNNQIVVKHLRRPEDGNWAGVLSGKMLTLVDSELNVLDASKTLQALEEGARHEMAVVATLRLLSDSEKTFLERLGLRDPSTDGDSVSPSQGELEPERVALLVANGAYDSAPLQNPTVDADLVRPALEEMGFDVTVVKDANLEAFVVALDRFYSAAKGADIAAFYFAGHGFALNSPLGPQNYLMSTSADVTSRYDTIIRAGGIALDDIAASLSDVAKVSLIFVDACRNDPRVTRGKGRGRGLARISDVGTTSRFVGLSTRLGDVADDGETGIGSPFARAFAEFMPMPGRRIDDAFRRLRLAVIEETGGAQQPEARDDLNQPLIVTNAGLLATDRNAIALGIFTDESDTMRHAQPPCSEGVVAEVAGAPHCLGPGDAFKDCDACPEMVVIPAGEFLMGSPASEAGRQDNEGPQHKVTIEQPLAVGRVEVTRREFAAFVGDRGHDASSGCWTYERGGKWEERSDRSWRTPGFSQDDTHPVVCVNWDDAKAYAAWLSRTSGETYRLFSEAEWEYATRAGTTTPYSTGREVTTDHANFGFATFDQNEIVPPRKKTVPAGSFAANPFGLHDMHGNVWEWTEDCWNKTYAGAPTDGSAWATGDCTKRVRRGGSWALDPQSLRSAMRFDGDSSDIRLDDLGFRVARTLAEP